MSRRQSTITFPCLQLRQGHHELVCFIANAKVLWDLVKINEREPDKDIGYQRTLSHSRVAAIARFIDQGNSIPNTILLSLDAPARILPDGHISIPKREDAGWVIDGQHRLAGAKEAETDIDLIVIAFLGLSLEEQIRQFVVINREAKALVSGSFAAYRP